jgi:hypothetical protein
MNTKGIKSTGDVTIILKTFIFNKNTVYFIINDFQFFHFISTVIPMLVLAGQI